MKITVFLSDWHTIFREGMHFTLISEDDIEVIGEASTGEQALSCIESRPPRVAILNANGDKVSGVEVTRRIRHHLPLVSVILIMDNEDEELLFSVLKSGARACLSKKEVDPHTLITTIRQVVLGGQTISKELLRGSLAIHVLDEFETVSSISQPVSDLLAHLTPREGEVLRLIGEGSTREQVASNLGISEDAVSDHLDLILSKLVANDYSQQLIEATQRGMAAEYITKEEITESKIQPSDKPEVEYIPAKNGQGT